MAKFQISKIYIYRIDELQNFDHEFDGKCGSLALTRLNARIIVYKFSSTNLKFIVFIRTLISRSLRLPLVLNWGDAHSYLNIGMTSFIFNLFSWWNAFIYQLNAWLVAVRWWVIAEAVQYKCLKIIIFQYFKAIKAFRKALRVKEGQIHVHPNFQVNFGKSSICISTSNQILNPFTIFWHVQRPSISINDSFSKSLAHADMRRDDSPLPLTYAQSLKFIQNSTVRVEYFKANLLSYKAIN